MEERNLRKTLIGIVESNKMDKTIVVKVETAVRHPIYKKIVKRTYKLKAHDEENVCQIVTFGTMAAKNSIKDVGRVMRVPYSETYKLTKIMDGKTSIGDLLGRRIEAAKKKYESESDDDKKAELIARANEAGVTEDINTLTLEAFEAKMSKRAEEKQIAMLEELKTIAIEKNIPFEQKEAPIDELIKELEEKINTFEGVKAE